VYDVCICAVIASVCHYVWEERNPQLSVGFQNQKDPQFQQRTPPWTSTPTSHAKAWRTFAPGSCTSSPTPPARTSIPPAPTTGSRPPPWRPVTTSSTAGKTDRKSVV